MVNSFLNSSKTSTTVILSLFILLTNLDFINFTAALKLQKLKGYDIEYERKVTTIDHYADDHYGSYYDDGADHVHVYHGDAHYSDPVGSIVVFIMIIVVFFVICFFLICCSACSRGYGTGYHTGGSTTTYHDDETEYLLPRHNHHTTTHHTHVGLGLNVGGPGYYSSPYYRPRPTFVHHHHHRPFGHGPIVHTRRPIGRTTIVQDTVRIRPRGGPTGFGGGHHVRTTVGPKMGASFGGRVGGGRVGGGFRR